MEKKSSRFQERFGLSVFLLWILLAAVVLNLWAVPAEAAGTVGTPQPPTESGGTNPQQPTTVTPGNGGSNNVTPGNGSSNIISTQFSGMQRTVTLTVNIAENSQATSGKIKIYYPSDLLTLSNTQSGNLWKIEDANTGLEEMGKKGLSYAWADTQTLTRGGNLLTVTMEAQDGADGREVVVETEIVELFSREQPIAVNTNKITDRLWLNFQGTASSTQPSSDSSSSSSDSSSSAVRTGDDTNAAGYALLCLGSMLVMVELMKRKMAG